MIHETIGAIAGQYIQARYGGGSYARPTQSQMLGFNGGGMVRPVDTHMDPSSVIDYATGYDPCKKQCWDPRANCGQGKWIDRGRSRRKRLATKSDISDLAALSAVLKPENLKTWIATHA